MRRTLGWSLVVGLVGWSSVGLAQSGESEAEVALVAPRYDVTAATSPIEIDGVLDEPAWADAVSIERFWEWFPGDNVEPPVESEALITFDEKNVYIAFRAFDPEPEKIRANYMDRDNINTFVQDDHVSFMIDPFDDERRAFQFRLNPFGVQADAVFSQVEFIEDFSWDILWESAGRIEDWGYAVEAAIPVSQLRFPSTDGPQTWGWEIGRSWPRDRRHRMSANPRDRSNNCILCQINKVTGFEGFQPGRNLEINPTITGKLTEVRDDFPDGEFATENEELEPGLTVQWGATAASTLAATINPDFSQIEADAAQLDVNERFALFFPEARPFFLEGIDFFATPINVIFTRTVADPDWGLKFTGKAGRNGGGTFVTQDSVNNLILPSNQGSRSIQLDDDVLGSVLRYRRDIGANSTLGVVYTGREGDREDYRNRVGGVDGFFRLTQRDEVRFQYLYSDTIYPGDLAADFDQPRGSFTDDAWAIDYSHNDRNWQWGLEYEDFGEDFRADFGFVPRVDYREGEASVGYTWWGEAGDWYNNQQVEFEYERTENQAGLLTDASLDLEYSFSGPRQSFFIVSAERNTTFFVDTEYDDLLRLATYFEFQPHALGKYALFVDYGDTVDFANNQPADVLVVAPEFELKPGKHLNLQFDHVYQKLEVEDGTLSEANLSELRAVYNFNVRTFVRAIFQYLHLEQDPDLFDRPVEEKAETLFTQLLFSYKLNARTVLFVGYSDNYLGLNDISLTQRDRTLFAKIGYAWVL